MSGRDSDDEQPSTDSRMPRLLMVAVLTLAVASTAVLVLTSNAAWLRLGVLAALWAALLGVFLASRFRKSLTERENEVADLQSVYELELEREVAARREYELEVEASTRKRVEEENRHDLAELRAELRTLRESLERLTGGEVLVERFALQARSTRMRALGDAAPRVVSAAEDSGRMRRSIMAGQPDAASTELMRRPELPAAQQVQQPQRRAAYRPEPARPQAARDADEPRQDVPTAVVAPPTRVTRPVRQESRQQPRRPARPPEPQEPQQVWPSQAPSQAALTQRGPQPVRRQPPPRQPDSGGHRGAAEPEPTRRAEPVSRHRVEEAHEQGGRRRAEESWQTDDVETTGAHAAGKSVTELLAAHGQDDPPRRHRRRAD